MIEIRQGDCRSILHELPEGVADCIVTSPPYFGLRDYGVDGQIGLEATPDDYVDELVEVFRSARRILKDEGTLWLNLGDSYAGTGRTGGGAQGARTGAESSPTGKGSWWSPKGTGLKVKDLIGIPWRVAFALQADGWWLRSAIVWHKPNPMPESVVDRPTSSYEMVFLLAKSERYFYDAEAIKEPDGGKPAGNGYVRDERISYGGRGNEKPWTPGTGRNARNVWTIPTQGFAEAHFATMAPDLAERCIKAGCPAGGTVLDPFGGAGTTGLVADRLQRNAILIELNPKYAALARRRIAREAGLFAEISGAAK